MPPDIEIAQSANMKHISEIAESLGLNGDDIELYGKYKAKILPHVLKEREGRPDGKLIVVTAVTPTKSGEGKTTMAVGLAQALGHIGKKNIVVLRQPSMGPVFGIKGGAAGGGYAQVVPMDDINIHFTGDLHAITCAHDLLTSLMENSIQRKNKLDIDTQQIMWKRVLDIESRFLRNIVVGLGDSNGGRPYQTGFEITTASEIAAIHAISKDLMDCKERMGEITLAYNSKGEAVKAKDVGGIGAMAILMKDAIKPNLVQTLENTPAIIHGGPFANIAHGCPSLAAIKTALKLTDYVVVEPGFGADLGMEKFLNIASRAGDLKPSVVVVVATIKALKRHGGIKYKNLKEVNAEAVKVGLPILANEVDNVRKYGLRPVVCMNHFHTDGDDEIKVVLDWAKEAGVPAAFTDTVLKGGVGGVELANIVLEEVEKESDFHYLYDLDMPVDEKIRAIATKMYKVADIKLNAQARKNLRKIVKLGFDKLPICMAKTPLSLTDNDKLLGMPPEGYVLPIVRLKPSTGVGFIIAYCGDINTMPAHPSKPAANDMDIDENGVIKGLS
ncbi:formate--tetrahydrofolate ligase [Candidatus Bathyarchaeota archaeon]|nr:formate--tetrahydrofolate ligase [Candidatus Bathyarchaeota archaeon]MBT4319921.1 formate--tetrahydrofolate ligase [Candidatus Bathyarchaeota archaeon]MBT4422843.1 formate--tetrahydrofolate ligase [Candidatus Bathyarchaeota archaeon]MBT5643459.1 formate--tetrahydrofolate ligase [Candidatus Bathyarchaeota archaeon]MBT6605758.1 formate--tetrahydrofolate ligase [Candidatus Bathyarchaeota archaeon]